MAWGFLRGILFITGLTSKGLRGREGGRGLFRISEIVGF